MESNGDVEMASKPAADDTDKAISPKQSEDDIPPTPPRRNTKASDKPIFPEPEKRKTNSWFVRPEVIYKPEKTNVSMSCLKISLIIINVLILGFGAAMTGIGAWIKADEDFGRIQTDLDMKYFANASIILIIAGVAIMILGVVGCCGAFFEIFCLLIIFSIVMILIILLEIAVMALVWTASTNKEVKEEIKVKARKAMQEMTRDEYQLYFLNLLQTKLECCGVDGPDDYEKEGIPRSCTDPSTGYPYKQGCLESIANYFKSKAGILGGVAVAVFVFQLAAVSLTICLACGVRQAVGGFV